MPSTPPPPLPDTTVTTSTLPPPSQPPPRKFPAPCWTQDETLALIHCYQDKWFSLRRRNLRTADWEAVAEDVNRRCPNQSPPKTSAQCRHKMEKLRKRYRAEKQRISNLPLNYNHNTNHRFYPSSSWVFFDLMDSMELGSTSTVPGSGSGSTSIIPSPVVNNPALLVKEKNSHNGNFQNGFGANVNDGITNSSNGGGGGGGGREDLGKYFDEILRSVGKSGIAAPSTKLKVKNNNTHSRNLNHNHLDSDKTYFDHDDDDEAEYEDSGYDHDPHLFNSKKRKFVGGERERERERISRGVSGLNGFPSFSSSKRGGVGGGGGGGRGEEAVGEMVASIKMLGEGMVKMEKMKMELMQDLEKQRMEMEMNNTRLILESQHNIVSAFLHGFKKYHHNSKKVVKVMQME